MEKEIYELFLLPLPKQYAFAMEYRIKELCKEKGILVKELAQKIGITDIGLRQSLNGNPTIATLEKIADALGVEVAELFRPADKAKIVCPYCGKTISLTPDKA